MHIALQGELPVEWSSHPVWLGLLNAQIPFPRLASLLHSLSIDAVLALAFNFVSGLSGING